MASCKASLITRVDAHLMRRDESGMEDRAVVLVQPTWFGNIRDDV
jgi:hypothetical protein